MKSFVNKFIFNRNVESYKCSVLKIIICTIVYILSINIDNIFEDAVLLNIPFSIIIRVIVVFVFLLSILEISLVFENRQNVKRNVFDYSKINDISINIISEYLYKRICAKLIILVDDIIVDIGCEPVSRKYLSNGDISKKYFYINENRYYYDIGFELFKKELLKKSNNGKLTLLINKKKTYNDEQFIKYLDLNSDIK